MLAVINNPLRAAIRNSVLSGLLDKYSTTLGAEAAQYYALSELIVLTGGFEVECDYATLAGGAFLGDTDFVRVSGGSYRLMINGSYVSTGIPATTDGSRATFGFRRNGNVGTLLENGSSIGDVTVDSGPFQIGALGSRGVRGNHFDGIISDYKIWANGNRDTGTLIVDFPLDQQIPADGTIPNNASGPGAPSYVTAINLLPSDSVQGDY